ncbi:hypothetical protein LEP1GSC173_1121 [Leptospira interrogans str. HAI1594]|uniref:Uncharacterized protein n=2 Tax=Leptospira interrogans TaxID=173 RepID=A0A0E2D2J5_LEPIR|nr:hypothetical protein LEP1GSC104_1833 [Leptospira interrogans str. UI 12621]EKO95748.1 hypothetical protein LEP1GSC057_1122 [Leptospira interrogans str. Brem 329]EKP75780.1 hypothetical protein LEP1GSC173_1121 [Leptospira interrogans str. HAI1594]EKR27451.1 hypothetical protein LEP1GSC087_1556 [Leptospira interrogans serovar Bataviae str. L1111]EKR46667.1 hypothetical protein LEP1GSC097_3065 [Leptospira interrogans serovar Grippotyphosa str. UI 08368]EKR54084.1 hypothetical protein LEP1GSC10
MNSASPDPTFNSDQQIEGSIQNKIFYQIQFVIEHNPSNDPWKWR